MRVHVEALRGGPGNAPPARFHLGDSTVEVTHVLDRWHGEGAVFFRVRGNDAHTYVLKRNLTSGGAGSWEMVSFTHKNSRGMGPDTAEDSQVLH